MRSRPLWTLVLLFVAIILASCGSKEQVAPPVEEPVAEEPTDYQVEAVKGEDIPLFERPRDATFVEPDDRTTFRDIHFEYDKHRIRMG